MDSRLLENLTAVRDFLEQKRAQLNKELEEVERTLTGIRKEISAIQDEQPKLFPDAKRLQQAMYFNISMRWAILWYLSERMTRPSPTVEVASALRYGGFAERPNFNSIVSAILSQMVAKGEISKVENGFVITEAGSNAWDAIRRSEKFLNRHLVVNAINTGAEA